MQDKGSPSPWTTPWLRRSTSSHWPVQHWPSRKELRKRELGIVCPRERSETWLRKWFECFRSPRKILWTRSCVWKRAGEIVGIYSSMSGGHCHWHCPHWDSCKPRIFLSMRTRLFYFDTSKVTMSMYVVRETPNVIMQVLNRHYWLRTSRDRPRQLWCGETWFRCTWWRPNCLSQSQQAPMKDLQAPS